MDNTIHLKRGVTLYADFVPIGPKQRQEYITTKLVNQVTDSLFASIYGCASRLSNRSTIQSVDEVLNLGTEGYSLIMHSETFDNFTANDLVEHLEDGTVGIDNSQVLVHPTVRLGEVILVPDGCFHLDYTNLDIHEPDANKLINGYIDADLIIGNMYFKCDDLEYITNEDLKDPLRWDIISEGATPELVTIRDLQQ